jgi:hypothetical protein
MIQLVRRKSNAIDFYDFVAKLEIKYKIDFHDWQKTHKQTEKLCKERGLDYITWYNKQFTKMTPLELEVKELSDKIPYQNVWHWLIENDFDEPKHGPGNFLDFSENRIQEEIPNFVKEFFKIAHTELVLNGVTEDEVEFYLGY